MTHNLTLAERERITDSVLKIQSVRNSLEHVGDEKIPAREEIENCLESADNSLRTALGRIIGRSSADAEKGTPRH